MDKKIALITGASRGLGFALTKSLLATGWYVVIDARSAEALKSAKISLDQPENLTCISGDVADIEHVQELYNVIQNLGHLDLLVNNASSLGPTPLKFLAEYPVNSLEQVYRVNVFAPLQLFQSLRPLLKKNAKIINITSDAGAESYPRWGGYGSSKAALEHLSSILAAEQPELYIYWVDPGDMQTKMQQDANPGDDISELPLPEDVVPGFLKLIQDEFPSGRYKAQEIL